MEWKISILKESDLSGSTLFVGLPGIGNVSKIVVDFIIEQLKAEKVAEFFSYHMPHSVFVREDNLIEMPKIELFFIKDKKLLILTGDSQPIDEIGTYGLCDAVLDFFQKSGCKEILTFGGIGLDAPPEKPRVFITGNDKDMIENLAKDTGIILDIHGVVGPIIGTAGLILGLAGRRKIRACSLLAETLGHPMFLGLKSSREILSILNQKYSLNADLKNLESEIDELETKMKLAGDLVKSSGKRKDVNYIG